MSSENAFSDFKDSVSSSLIEELEKANEVWIKIVLSFKYCL